MKQDLLAKRYYSDNRRFADLINGIVCNGIPIVKQEDLSEMDTENGQGKRPGKTPGSGAEGSIRCEFCCSGTGKSGKA